MNLTKAIGTKRLPIKKPTGVNLQIRINPRETVCKAKWVGLVALMEAMLHATCLLEDRSDKAHEITSNNYFDLAVIKIEDETEIFHPKL